MHRRSSIGELSLIGVSVVGTAVARRPSSPMSSPTAPPASVDVDSPATAEVERPRRRIQWDEDGIQAHDAERGVLFGTMKVGGLETPYLYLEEGDEEGGTPAIHPKYLPTHVPHVEPPSAPGPYKVPLAELRHALGVLETQLAISNEDLQARPKSCSMAPRVTPVVEAYRILRS